MSLRSAASRIAASVCTTTTTKRRLKRVVDFCRQYGVAKLGIQLAHAGRERSGTSAAAGGKPLAADENPGRP